MYVMYTYVETSNSGGIGGERGEDGEGGPSMGIALGPCLPRIDAMGGVSGGEAGLLSKLPRKKYTYFCKVTSDNIYNIFLITHIKAV